MSNESKEPEQPSSGEQAIDRRAWSRERQLFAAGIGCRGGGGTGCGCLAGRRSAWQACKSRGRGVLAARHLPRFGGTDEDPDGGIGRTAWFRQRGADRRENRRQRRSRDTGVFALFGPDHAGHRRPGRQRQGRCAARDAGGIGIRAGAKRSCNCRLPGEARAPQRSSQARAIRGQRWQLAGLAIRADRLDGGADIR